MMKKFTAIATFILYSLFLTGSSIAGTKAVDDAWNFTLAPMFLWGKSIEGAQQIGPASSGLDLSFKDDILENLAAAFTIHFEAQKNDLTLFVDYQYANLDPSSETALGRSVRVDLTDQAFEVGAAYRVATFGINDLQVLGGARYIRLDQEVDIDPGIQLADIREHWWDGFIGLRIFTHISDNWTFIGRGDVGAGGSEITWNGLALIDYRFKNWGSLFCGYRWFDIDYDSGDGRDRFVYDVTQQGPVVGLAFYW